MWGGVAGLLTRSPFPHGELHTPWPPALSHPPLCAQFRGKSVLPSGDHLRKVGGGAERRQRTPLSYPGRKAALDRRLAAKGKHGNIWVRPEVREWRHTGKSGANKKTRALSEKDILPSVQILLLQLGVSLGGVGVIHVLGWWSPPHEHL